MGSALCLWIQAERFWREYFENLCLDDPYRRNHCIPKDLPWAGTSRSDVRTFPCVGSEAESLPHFVLCGQVREKGTATFAVTGANMPQYVWVRTSLLAGLLLAKKAFSMFKTCLATSAKQRWRKTPSHSHLSRREKVKSFRESEARHLVPHRSWASCK